MNFNEITLVRKTEEEEVYSIRGLPLTHLLDSVIDHLSDHESMISILILETLIRALQKASFYEKNEVVGLLNHYSNVILKGAKFIEAQWQDMRIGFHDDLIKLRNHLTVDYYISGICTCKLTYSKCSTIDVKIALIEV